MRCAKIEEKPDKEVQMEVMVAVGEGMVNGVVQISIVTKLPTWIFSVCTVLYCTLYCCLLLLQYTSLLLSTYITIAYCYLLTLQLLAAIQ